MIYAIRSPRDILGASPFGARHSTALVLFFTHMFPKVFPAKAGTEFLPLTSFGAGSVCFTLVLFVTPGIGLRA